MMKGMDENGNNKITRNGENCEKQTMEWANDIHDKTFKIRYWRRRWYKRWRWEKENECDRNKKTDNTYKTKKKKRGINKTSEKKYDKKKTKQNWQLLYDEKDK